MKLTLITNACPGPQPLSLVRTGYGMPSVPALVTVTYEASTSRNGSHVVKVPMGYDGEFQTITLRLNDQKISSVSVN